MNQTQILVVEDEALIALDIQKTLISYGYSVPSIVSSGEEALQKAQELRPDLALMDIHLQGKMNGIEAAVQMRKNYQIPFIYLTSFADDETLRQARESNPFGFIVKPCLEKELHAVIEIALDNAQLEREQQSFIVFQDKYINTLRDIVTQRQESTMESSQNHRELNEFVKSVSSELQDSLADLLDEADRLFIKNLVIGRFLKLIHVDSKLIPFQDLRTSAKKTFRLINNFCDLFSLETPESTFDFKMCDFRTMAHEALRKAKSFSNDKEIRLVNEVSASLQFPSAMVKADSRRIVQVLNILLDNAIKFTPRLGTVSLIAVPEGKGLVVKIKDTGIGIDPENISKLFHPNKRLRTPGTGGEVGNGLGLIIAQRIIQAHGSSIEVTSGILEGCCFSFVLPWWIEIES